MLYTWNQYNKIGKIMFDEVSGLSAMQLRILIMNIFSMTLNKMESQRWSQKFLQNMATASLSPFESLFFKGLLFPYSQLSRFALCF